MRVLAICGSLQAESTNLDLLRLAQKRAPAGMDIEIFDGLRHLPLFNPDIETAPEPVKTWRAALSATDAVLVATPEYGHSLPGGLKNAIDWVIGTGELERKIVAITASAAGEGRGLLGLEALNGTLGAVSARIVGGAPLVRGPRQEAQLVELLDELAQAVATRAS